MIGAGYCLYSSSTIFVLTLGNGVYGFTYDSAVGEFILSHPDIKIPDSGPIYSFNEGNYNVRALRPISWGAKGASLSRVCVACVCLDSNQRC